MIEFQGFKRLFERLCLRFDKLYMSTGFNQCFDDRFSVFTRFNCGRTGYVCNQRKPIFLRFFKVGICFYERFPLHERIIH